MDPCLPHSLWGTLSPGQRSVSTVLGTWWEAETRDALWSSMQSGRAASEGEAGQRINQGNGQSPESSRGCAESRAGAMDVPQRQGLFLRGKTSRDLSDWRQLSQVERAGGPQEEKLSRGSASSRASRARGGQGRELGFLSRSRVNPGGLQAGPLSC